MRKKDEDTLTVDEGPPESERRATPRPSRYQLDEVIGRGGMGEIVAARDSQIAREVAVKRLRTPEPTTRHIERFLREAQIQGRLDHPAIVPVYELGRDDNGLPYFVMKKLSGRTLSQILKSDAGYPRQRLLRAFVEVCLAIEYAHVRGVLHRDIKPANIVLGEFNEVYVLDWGVAKILGDTDEFEDIVVPGTEVTQSGTVVGTPGYMSPEQAAGGQIDERSDVYSLGRVLGAILEYGRESTPELEALRDIATRAAPAERLPTARELGERVQRYLDGDRDLALRKKLAIEHLSLAKAAFAARHDEEQHAIAMREAGSALALDPTNRDAVEMVGRLMLEPPKRIPGAVEKAIDEDDRRIRRDTARASLWGYAGFLAVVPSLVAIKSAWLWLVFTLIVGANVLAAYITSVRRQPLVAPVLLLANIVAIVFVARLYSPILIAPAIAVLMAITHALDPLIRTLRMVVLLAMVLFLSVHGSIVFEHLELLPSTLEFHAGGIFLHGPGLQQGSMFLHLAGALYVLTIITASVVVGRLLRRDNREARMQLHLQAWQLRQLVPDSGL